MKILKFLSGGTPMFQPMTDPFKAMNQQQAAATTASSSKKESGLISDDLVKRLYDNGIPTDVDSFLEKVGELERKLELGLPVSSSMVRKLEALGNRVILQGKYLKNAEEAMAKNDSAGEIAVGSRGELFVADGKKGVKKVNAKDFDADKMVALTVGLILEMRKFNPSQAWDETIIPAAGRNIGMSLISAFIQNIVKAVGSSETTGEAYTNIAGMLGQAQSKRPSQAELENLQYLASAVDQLGADAIFKNKKVLLSKNMQEAMAYISSVMPVEMKRLLISRSIASGATYEEATQGISQLIALACATGNDTKEGFYTDYAKDMNEIVGTKAGLKSEKEKTSSKTFYLTPLEAFFDLDLNQTTIEISNPKNGNKDGLALPGNIMPGLTTDKGEAVTNLPLNIALNASMGKYLDKSKIYVGNQKLNGEAELANIAYGSDRIALVHMPVTSDGNIDWQGFYAASEAEEEIKRNHIVDPLAKNEIHVSKGSYIRYDSDNKVINNQSVAQFVMSYGYTIDDHIDTSSNDLVEELEGDAEKAADELIGAIYNKETGKRTGYKKMPNKNIWDDIIRVPVFIKVNDFASGDAYRYAGHGSSMTPRTLKQDMILERLNSPIEQGLLILGTSSLLYLNEE